MRQPGVHHGGDKQGATGLLGELATTGHLTLGLCAPLTPRDER